MSCVVIWLTWYPSILPMSCHVLSFDWLDSWYQRHFISSPLIDRILLLFFIRTILILRTPRLKMLDNKLFFIKTSTCRLRLRCSYVLIHIFSNSHPTPTPNICLKCFSWPKLSFETFPYSYFKCFIVFEKIPNLSRNLLVLVIKV